MRTTLTSSFLSGWNTYNQNKAATSGNALAPTYLSHTQAPPAGRGQLLGDDPDFPKTQPGRVADQPVLQPDFVIAEIA
jgi:hypothetical protein